MDRDKFRKFLIDLQTSMDTGRRFDGINLENEDSIRETFQKFSLIEAEGWTCETEQRYMRTLFYTVERNYDLYMELKKTGKCPYTTEYEGNPYSINYCSIHGTAQDKAFSEKLEMEKMKGYDAMKQEILDKFTPIWFIEWAQRINARMDYGTVNPDINIRDKESIFVVFEAVYEKIKDKNTEWSETGPSRDYCESIAIFTAEKYQDYIRLVCF